ATHIYTLSLHDALPISLVKLFSSILKLEDGKYFLVTPVEKVGITVEDAPFVAVDFRLEGEGAAQAITFTTHVDDEVTAGSEHPRSEEHTSELSHVKISY